MKQFDLKECLKDPNKKVVIRDGRNVRIICTDRKGTAYSVIALCTMSNGSENCCFYFPNGKMHMCEDSHMDLFFAPEKKEGWINIFRGKYNPFTGNIIFVSKEEAEESGRHCCGFIYITSGKVEWEE